MIDASKLTEEQKKIISDYANGHGMTFDETIVKLNQAADFFKTTMISIAEHIAKSLDPILSAFENFGNSVLKYQSNNWLKMHGLPMRRR